MKGAGEPPTRNAGSALAEWRRGWLLVVSAMVAYGTATVYIYSLGLFMAPLQNEFGWSRGLISSGLMLSTTLSAMAAPFAGRLIDVWGSRRVGLPGMVAYCVAIALLASSGPLIWNWWFLWIIMACGSTTTKATVWVSAISKSFVVQRGMAMAVVMSGAGLAASITPTITNLLIANYGWRWAYVLLGLGLAALNLPLLFLFFREQRAAQDTPGQAQPEQAGSGIRSAVLSRRFVQLAVIAFMMTVSTTGLNVHFVPIMSSLGLGRGHAAAIAGFIGIGAVIGRLATGFLLDRFHAGNLGAVAFLLPVCGSTMLLVSPATDAVTGSFAALLFGLSLGAELDVVAYLTARYFGLRNYGTLFGSLVGILALAGGVGPTMAGYLFDITGGYAIFLYLTIGCFALSAVLVRTLGPYPVTVDGPPAR